MNSIVNDFEVADRGYTGAVDRAGTRLPTLQLAGAVRKIADFS